RPPAAVPPRSPGPASRSRGRSGKRAAIGSAPARSPRKPAPPSPSCPPSARACARSRPGFAPTRPIAERAPGSGALDHEEVGDAELDLGGERAHDAVELAVVQAQALHDQPSGLAEDPLPRPRDPARRRGPVHVIEVAELIDAETVDIAEAQQVA